MYFTTPGERPGCCGCLHFFWGTTLASTALREARRSTQTGVEGQRGKDGGAVPISAHTRAGHSVFSLRELARVGAGLSEAALLWTPPAKPLTGDMKPSGGVATIGQPEGGVDPPVRTLIEQVRVPGSYSRDVGVSIPDLFADVWSPNGQFCSSCIVSQTGGC